MKNSLKNGFILIFLLFLYVFICANSYVTAVSDDLSNAVFRLHVIANSDSDEDQNLKLKVRDNLLQYMNTISSDCSTKEEAISIANMHKEDFYKIAKQTLSKYEKGQRRMSVEFFNALCNILELSPAEVLNSIKFYN